MDSESFSDAELVELVRNGGESARVALAELGDRHFDAVRAFASICLNDPSTVDGLAGRAWQRAASPGVLAAGAVRPQVLEQVLRAAASVAGTVRDGVLDAGLATWLGTQPPSDEGSPGGEVTFFHQGSVTARAFGSLPASLQTVMWHHLVERADNAWTARMLGSGSPEAQEVSVLIRRAHRDFYYAYEQIHQYGMADECRSFHRMVMAYADRRGGNTADVIGHLEQCGYCARAVADLEHMQADFGDLLAQALLPWGGQRYAAGRRDEWAGTTMEIPVVGREDTRTRRRAAEPATAPAPVGVALATGAPWGSGPPPAPAPAPAPVRSRDRVRGRRLTQVVAAVGVCSAAVAFAYAQGVGPKLSELAGEVPSKEGPSTAEPRDPDPSDSAPDSPSPSPTASKGGEVGPPPDGRDRRQPPPSPAVRGAALEWLFKGGDDAKGGVAEDGSGNGNDGTPAGDPLPKPLADGGLSFFGDQSVTSRGPVLDTDKSFSVSARVKLRDTDEYQTVASQDGSEISSFQLQYDAQEKRWEMRMHTDDSRTSRADEAESDAAPRADRWTDLTGVWDASDERIRLYVDGELQDSVRREGDRSSEGEFAVGRAQLGDQSIRGFDGTIAEVRAFPRALTGAEAKELARGEGGKG